MQKLLVATGNSHKTDEIRAILGSGYAVSDLKSYPELPEVEETGTTFHENAALKALEISKQAEGLVLSDDSGLEVDALGDEPGVYSARYARMGDDHGRFYIDNISGRAGDDAANNAKLLWALGEEGNRKARFRCVMVLAQAGELLASFDGAVEGRMLDKHHGKGGFGYDPLFVPDGYDETFAELSSEVKNQLSHRARAMEKVVAWLADHTA
jgi:XTP/dITP diphosphohydrolase